jgi:son of sevenless-like protein
VAEAKSQEVMLDPARIPVPILPRDLSRCDFEDLDPIEVARQLTLLEETLYRAIKPQECLNQAWNKTNKDQLAPNILAVIRRFNKVSNWVAYSIVRYENIHRRVWSFERFVTIAKHLRADHHNYNAVQEILSGLHSSPVYRLKKTRDALKKTVKKELLSLEKLMANDNNYSNFRTALHSESPPCIPYLGNLTPCSFRLTPLPPHSPFLFSFTTIRDVLDGSDVH